MKWIYLLVMLLIIPFITAFNFDSGIEITSITTGSSVIGNITNFTSLLDTPASYVGEGTNCVKVNAGATALEFSSCAVGTGDNASWNQTLADTLYSSIIWNYNQSLATYNLWNSDWISTYNATYDAIVGDNSSWNENMAYGLFLNRTSESDYLSTYNATYDLWAYNQTTTSGNPFNQDLNTTDDINFASINLAGTVDPLCFSEAQCIDSGDGDFTFNEGSIVTEENLVIEKNVTFDGGDIYSNATCIKIKGATSILEIC